MTIRSICFSVLIIFLTSGKYMSATPRYYESGANGNVGRYFDQHEASYDDPPCPNAADILPCKCYFNVDNGYLSMVCNDVADIEELRTVFLADFPQNNFTTFRLEDNTNLKVFESGIFNGITFRDIYIRMTSIENIDIDAFDDSLETIRELNFLGNNLTQFPYEMLNKFSNLTVLDLSGNPLGSVPVDSFNGITTLTELHLNVIHVDELLTGSFQNLENLEILYLNANSLTHIPSGLFITGSSVLHVVHLYHNKIESVDPDAFDNIGMYIDMDDNAMTSIEENTWRPLLEGGAKLDLARNPLLCGCDVAWLVRNSTLLQRVTSDSYCNDDYGHSIWNLNPSDFDDC
ncbi:unnamed protein product [Meganyctiphanes norvegica]|uniref:Oplophorus-luciferin 2-monooxygenase non-catalytic subunit n=1 Tax=Meganyctiphanes norvegica TaxID=48144 RepID=A0AAV2S2P0_MEGNR